MLLLLNLNQLTQLRDFAINWGMGINISKFLKKSIEVSFQTCRRNKVGNTAVFLRRAAGRCSSWLKE